ncbi:MAG: chemotaxis protein CheX [Spirochaetota bacterium]
MSLHSPFVNSLENYFSESNINSGVKISQIQETKTFSQGLEFSGIIGFSGDFLGSLFFSADREFLGKLTETMLGTRMDEEEMLLDMIGEFTNTIAGNASQAFEDTLLISTPVVIRGKISSIQLKQLEVPIYYIKVSWDGSSGILVIGIEKYREI